MTQSAKNDPHELRVEDDVLLRGAGRFLADLKPHGAAIVAFVRSPHAAARIRSVDTAAARAAPGVLAVLTAEDMDKAGIGSVARPPPMTAPAGIPFANPFRPPPTPDPLPHI